MRQGVVISIEIIDDVEALEKFEEQIRGTKITIYQVGERVLYGIGDDGEALNGAIEENAFVLNLDYARAKLVYLDKKAGRVADSNSFFKQFASENDVYDIQDGIPVSLLPELIDYISENHEMLENDIVVALDTDEGDYESNANIIDKQQKSSDSLDNDDEFVDDVEEEEVQVDKVEKESEESATVEELDKEIDRKDENDNDPIDVKNEGKGTKSSPMFNTVKKDPLLEKAITLFDTQHYVTLPEFDELTHKELQEQLIESHFTVKKARDEGIRKIYQRMKEETTESAQAIREQVLKNQKAKHKEQLKIIENNYKSEVDKLLNKHNAEYEKVREDYVQSQIPVIRKQYDAQHAKDHQSVINIEIEKLQKNSMELMSKERKKYQEYVDKVLSDSKEQVVSSVRVDDIIEEYNKIATEQKELLLLQAKSKKKEIGVTLSEIVKERDALKEQINGYESKIKEQKQSEQERIESGVTAGIREKEQRILEENKVRLDKAVSREQELLNQIERLENDLASEKENKEMMKREYIVPTQEIASGIDTTKDSKNEKQEIENGYSHLNSSKFSKLKFILGTTFSLTFLLLIAFGVFILNNMNTEMAKSNYINQSSYLAQLEVDGRIDRAAVEMDKLGYSDERIAEMYLDNGAYMEALEKNKAMLPDVYRFVDEKEDLDEKKQILENMKNSDSLDESQLKGLDVRLAILNEDTESVNVLTENIESVDTESIRKAASYLIDKKSFEFADKLVKHLKDEDLANELSQAKKSDLTQRIDKLNEEIDSLTKEQADAVDAGNKLQSEFDKIKEDDKKARDKKQNQIKDNKSKQEDITKTLSEKQEELEELQKQM